MQTQNNNSGEQQCGVPLNECSETWSSLLLKHTKLLVLKSIWPKLAITARVNVPNKLSEIFSEPPVASISSYFHNFQDTIIIKPVWTPPSPVQWYLLSAENSASHLSTSRANTQLSPTLHSRNSVWSVLDTYKTFSIQSTKIIFHVTCRCELLKLMMISFAHLQANAFLKQ